MSNRIIAEDSIDVNEAPRQAENAQQTAGKAASGVTSLNDPNLMSVIEKQNTIAQFSGLTSQYNVIVQNARDDGIDTTAVTTAYNNLNQFMADILADPDHASDINRVTYKKYQDAYNEELANIQNALQNNANNKFASAASAASQAAIATSQAFSAADGAFSQAQGISNRVDSEMAVQSKAADKAQSAADSAFSKAKTAIDTGQAASQAVTALKDGSKLTIAELENGLATKVANSEYASYKTQTASQVAQMVTSGAFSAYSQATAELISAKVTTSDFASYKDETAKAISSKVESKDFNSYKKQTDDAFENTVSSADYKSDKKQTANMISDTVSGAINGLTISNRNLALGTATAFKMTGNGSENNASQMYSISKKIVSGTTVTVAFDIASTNATGNYTIQFINGSWQAITGAPLTAGTQHQSFTLVTSGDQSDGVQLRLNNSTSDVTVSNFIISESSKEVSWTPAPEDQATLSQFTQLNNDIGLRVKKGDLLSQINMQAGYTLISASNQLTLSSKHINFDTDNPVIIPSANIDTLLVSKTLKTANISANTFTTNNGTFTVDRNGAVTANNMTINGGILTSPTINAGTITGSTINGTTINTPNLNLGDNGQLTGSYSVNDPTGYFQPINGTGSLNIDHGYIQSTANITYYNKILNGIGGDKWGHWESSTQFVPAPDQAHPDTSNVAESTLTPAFLKLDIFNADKSSVNSRAYMDGTGLYINDGQSQSITSMLSDYELLSSGMAYLDSGIQMKQDASFTFGNLAMSGYHTIAMLDGHALYFTNKASGAGSPIEVVAKTFTKSSRLSLKHDITPLSTAESSRLLNAIDVEKFRYTHDGATYKYQYGGVIDDVNSLGSKQYSMPPELLSEDGTGINLDSLTGILIKRVQDQDKMIGKLSMRLTKLEMEK
ncbi:hypothetical protein N6G94_10200 (plasmid) [Pediococcus inopinatus]|uniref:hypothetical protein n=1 Tax=Pediococcus inopinatus TaxID=114090 RepID=UPI002B257BA2|nr:hypothetical protein [Pediococcus inopinatus]WPC18528.1 hypothetical protein N6G94_10200 [Pediococcus inopinatus]